LESWKFIKNVHSSNSGKSQLNLINADTWEKYYYKLLIEDRKEFLGKNERLLENSTDNAIEIDSNTVKQTIMRMKNGKAAGPGHSCRVDKERWSKVTGNDYHIAE
jgi:hypothetical protein